MTTPSAGDAEVRIIPNFDTFAADVAHGMDAALQVAKNEVRNAFASLFRTALDRAVFTPLQNAAKKPMEEFGVNMAQAATNSFVRSMVEQMPGAIGRAMRTSLLAGATGGAESAGSQLASKLTGAFATSFGTKIGDAAAKGLVALYKAWTSVASAVSDLWAVTVNKLMDSGVLGTARKAGTAVGNALMSAWQAAIEKLKDWGARLLDIGKALGAKVLDGLKSAWAVLGPVAKTLLDGLRSAFDSAGTALTSIGRRIGDSLKTIFTDRIRPMFTAAGDAGRTSATALAQQFGQTAERDMGQAATETARTAGQRLRDGLTRFLRGGRIEPADLFGNQNEFQSGIGAFGQRVGRSFTDSLGTGISGATGSLQAKLRGLWDGFTTSASTAAENAARALATGLGNIARSLSGPLQRGAEALGRPFYSMANNVVNVVGRTLGRFLPENFRIASTNALAAMNRVLAPAAMTAIGAAVGGAIVVGLYKAISGLVRFAADVYTTISRGLLKVGQLGLQAGQAIVSGLGSALAGVGRVVASAVGTIARGLGDVGKSIATMAGTATAAVAGVGAAAVKAGIDYNILSSRSMAAFTTILDSGEAATKMMDDIKEFATTSPFPRQNFIEAAQLMTSFGIEANKVIPYLDGIQNATAAMGFGAEKINEITFVLSQIQAAGKITGVDLMQLGQRGINAAELIGEQMGKTGAQIKESITAGTLDATEALDALIAGMTKRYEGAAEGVKATWVGATDRIKGALRDIGSAIVEPFIGTRGGGMAVAWANEVADLLRALQKLIEPLANQFMSVMTPQLARISPVITGITESLGKLDIGKLGEAFAKVGPIIGAAGTALTVFAGKSLLGNIPIIGDFLGKFNPLLTGLLALVALSPELQQGLGAIVSGPLKQMGGLFGQFMPLFQQLSEILTGALMTAVRSLMPVVLAVVEQIAKLAPVLVDTLGAVATAFGPMARTIGSVLADVFNAFGPAISTVLSAVAQLAGPIGRVIGVIAQSFGQLLSSLGPAFSRIVEAIASTLTQLLPTVMPIIRQLGGMFSGLVRSLGPIIAQILPIVARLIAAVMPIIRQIFGTIGQVFAAIMPQLMPVIRVIGNALVQAFNALRPSLDVILPIFANLAQTLFPMLARVIESLAPLLPPIAEAFGKVAEFLARLLEQVLSSPVWEQFIDLIVNLAMTVLPPLLDAVMILLDPFGRLMPIIANLAQKVMPILARIFEAITPLLPIFADLIAAIANIFVDLVAAAMPIVDALLPPLASLFEIIMQLLRPLMPLFKIFVQLLGAGLGVVLQALTPLITILASALTAVFEVVNILLKPVIALIEVLVAALDFLGPSGVLGAVGRFIGRVMGWVGSLPRLISAAFAPLGRIFGAVGRFLQPVIDAFRTLVGWILGWSPGLIPAFKALGDIVRSVIGFIANIIKTIWNAVLKPIFTTMIDIIVRVAKFYWWFYSSVVKVVWNLIKAAFQFAWNNVIKPIFNFIGAAIRGVGKVFKWLADRFKIGWDLTKRFYRAAWNNVIKPIFDQIKNIIGIVGEAFRWLWRRVFRPIWDAIKEAFRRAWNNVIKPIFDAIKTANDKVGEAFRWLGNRVFKPIWNGIKESFRTAWNNVLKPIFDAFGTAIDAVKTAFRKMWEGIKWAWDKISSFLRRVWDNSIGKVLGFFQDMPGKIKRGFELLRDGLEKIMEKIKDFIKRPIVFVIDKIVGTLLRGINTLLRAVRIPEIPLGWIEAVKGMREGGRVPGGYGGGDRVPIMAEPGEWVLTKRQAKFLGYGNLHNLPRFAEGGMVGSNVHPGYFDNGPDVGPSPRWSLPGWANPVSWGKGVVKIGKGVWELGKDIVNKTTGLLRFAAAKAFEVMTKPLLNMATRYRDDEGANTFLRIMGGLMAKAITGAREFIWGKSEDAPEPEAIGVAAEVISAAKSRLGMPYVWAAKGPTSFDCSGLVQWAYAQAGIKGIGPNTREQITKGRAVKKPLLPADLIFWGNPPTPAGVYHVALSLGGNRLIEAPEPGRNVSIRDIYGSPSAFRRIIAESTFAGATAQGGWSGVVMTVLQRMGETKSLSDAVGGIMAILNPESSGNPRALNARDINWSKGIPSVGLMQMITPNMRAYKPRWGSTDQTPTVLRDRYNGRTFTVPAWMVDPATNIGAAVNYMKNRYGSVMGALRFRQRNNWYDQGGWLPPGISTVLNATGQPEPVLSPQQWEAISANRTEVVEVQVPRGPQRIVGGTMNISPDSQGRLRAWVQDLILDEADMDVSYLRMGGR